MTAGDFATIRLFAGVLMLALQPTGFGFSVTLLLVWLPTKTTEPGLNCYLTPVWGKKWIYTFPMGIYVKVNARNSTGI